MEFRRHDSDDRAPFPVDGDEPANDVRFTAEAALPEVVADNSYPVLTRLLFVYRELSSELRSHSYDREEIGSDIDACGSLRIAVFREIGGSEAERGDLLESPRLSPHFTNVYRNRTHWIVQSYHRAIQPQHDDPFRFAVSQRLEQDSIDDAEDRRVRADAERQCENGDRREAGILK